MIVYEKGKPKRSDYRKFKIKSVQGPNDYASMEEVLTRRFTHGLEESQRCCGMREYRGYEYGQAYKPFPDLILMDGGTRPGEHRAWECWTEAGHRRIPVCGMVKDDIPPHPRPLSTTTWKSRSIMHSERLPADHAHPGRGAPLCDRVPPQPAAAKARYTLMLDDIEGVGPMPGARR